MKWFGKKKRRRAEYEASVWRWIGECEINYIKFRAMTEDATTIEEIQIAFRESRLATPGPPIWSDA